MGVLVFCYFFAHKSYKVFCVIQCVTVSGLLPLAEACFFVLQVVEQQPLHRKTVKSMLFALPLHYYYGIIMVSRVLQKYVSPASRWGFVHGDTSWGIGYCLCKCFTASTRDLGFYRTCGRACPSAQEEIEPPVSWSLSCYIQNMFLSQKASNCRQERRSRNINCNNKQCQMTQKKWSINGKYVAVKLTCSVSWQ